MRISLSMSGRMTLTATASPLKSFAMWTWATDAAAMDSSVNASNISSSGRRESLLDDPPDVTEGHRRHLVLEFGELFDVSGGKRSARVLMSCPSLTKLGPSSSRANRTRSGAGKPCLADCSAPSGIYRSSFRFLRSLPAISPRPCLTRTRSILPSRQYSFMPLFPANNGSYSHQVLCSKFGNI